MMMGDWRTELTDAIQRAGNKLQVRFLNAPDPSGKQANYAAMTALLALKDELLTAPERADVLPEARPVEQRPSSAHDDGAGADPSTAGPALSSPPLECGVQHPVINVYCQVVPGDHIGRTHIWNGADGTTVTWSHQ